LCNFFLKEVEYQARDTNSSNCNKLSEKFLQNPKKIIGNCDNFETD